MAENNQTPVNQEDYEADLITLEDEEGKEHTFEVIDAADLDGVHYMALVPYVDSDEELLEADLELLLMRVGEDAEGEFMDIVEDEEELNKVSAMFEQRLSEFFDIEK